MFPRAIQIHLANREELHDPYGLSSTHQEIAMHSGCTKQKVYKVLYSFVQSTINIIFLKKELF